MRNYLLIIALCSLLLCSLIFFHSPHTLAESLSVSMRVGTTEIVFSGYTSPNTQVIFKEDGSVVGTIVSNSGGLFTKTISVNTPALHTYELYALDTLSLQSSTISYNLNVVGNTTTTIDNIVLPPTVNLTATTLSGSSYPGSTLTISSNLGDNDTLVTPSNGLWSYDLSSFLGGPHSITLITTVGSYLSISSASIAYTAPTPSPSSTPTPSSPSISVEPSTSPTYTPQSSTTITPSPSPFSSPKPFFISIYDSNNDNKLSLTELFDIVKNWLTKHLPCDLNRDQKCNLIDLSILLYYIER